MTGGREPLAELLASWTGLVDEALDRRLQAADGWPDRLREAMRYSTFAGGKRLRPLLVLLAADACLGALDAALPAACAVEMVHTYSLIHDDLPAMDDDDFRRGLPTCHKQFDEATAILAGDALLTLAFEALTDVRPSAVGLQCVRVLAAASGSVGMVGGQVEDLRAAEAPATLERLQSVHERKTGRLLAASLEMGALAAGATDAQRDALLHYGRKVGLAFQIADDLLDVVGDAAKLGKGVGKDHAAGKLTYPGLLGIDESRRQARELVQAACDHLRPFGPAGRRLAQLADYIVERDR
ncbi:MAG: polyprenyl synthetase family protein [Planctomycetia bacterium]